MKIMRYLGHTLVGSLLFVGVICADNRANNHIQLPPAIEKERATPVKALAEWTVVAYIQADNNLDSFADYNINDMQLALLPSSINMLVQLDLPRENKTWRFRVVHGGRVEDASLSSEMGTNPVQELVSMAQWAKAGYDAKHWCVILWNHGYGVIDPKYKVINRVLASAKNQVLPQATRQIVPWLEIPGLGIQKPVQDERGILFDDSQNTYATNQDLETACSSIKSQVLGKNIDILGMDACLMAMLEVGYQIKEYADFLVASEQTEPGEGWAYSGLLSALSANPEMDAAKFATQIVRTYGSFYDSRTQDYTQSAMRLNKVELIKQNINAMISAVAACKKADAQQTKLVVRAARRAAVSFDIADYIDLSSFYTAMLNQVRSKGNLQKAKASPKYEAASTALASVLIDGLRKIKNAVIANTTGSSLDDAGGIAVYYPRGNVHTSYYKTKFAKAIRWIPFIQEYY